MSEGGDPPGTSRCARSRCARPRRKRCPPCVAPALACPQNSQLGSSSPSHSPRLPQLPHLGVAPSRLPLCCPQPSPGPSSHPYLACDPRALAAARPRSSLPPRLPSAAHDVALLWLVLCRMIRMISLSGNKHGQVLWELEKAGQRASQMPEAA